MTMIFFKAKPATTAPTPLAQPTAVETRKPVEEAAVAKPKKSDTDGSLRRQRRTVDDNRLL
jgi:hypothetical protein